MSLINKSGSRNRALSGRRGFEINARTAGASRTIEVEVDKPLGLTLGQKSGGGVVITVSHCFHSDFPGYFHGLSLYIRYSFFFYFGLVKFGALI